MSNQRIEPPKMIKKHVHPSTVHCHQQLKPPHIYEEVITEFDCNKYLLMSTMNSMKKSARF